MAPSLEPSTTSNTQPSYFGASTMRAFPNTLLTALLLTATGTAFAASSVDLTVKG